MTNLRSFVKKLKNKYKSFQKPKWFQWSLTPKAGNPPTLSVLEAVVYLVVLCVGIWLFIQFNYIPHKSVIIEADRLSDYRYVEKATAPWNDDSTYFLHYERADVNLRIPMTFAKKQNKYESATTIEAEINSDSIPLKCIVEPNPLPDPISTRRIKNLSPISKYWNIVFERAVRDRNDEMLPAPNESVDTQTRRTNPNYSEYFETRDIYNKVTSNSRMKMIDSCEQQLKENLLHDNLLDKELISSYRMCTKQQNLGRYRNKSNFDSIPIVCLDCKKMFGMNYSIHKHYESKPYFIIDSYTAVTLSDKNCFLSKKDGGARFNYGFLGNKSGWFSLHDISQGYYDIELQTASIDSIQLTIDFVGAVTFWPSIEPDEKSGTYIKYSDPIKILKIRRDGLHLFYESKELANKQAIRVFAVTAFISGLFIIMLTFLIIGIYRAQRVFRELKKTNLNK